MSRLKSSISICRIATLFTRRAHVTCWAWFCVAELFLNVILSIGACLSTHCFTVDGEGASLLACAAQFAALAPLRPVANAFGAFMFWLHALLGLVCCAKLRCLGLDITKLARISTMLSLDEFNEVLLFDALVAVDTALCGAMAPHRVPFTLAMDRAWLQVIACFGVFASVLVWAFLATKSSLMGDGVGLLLVAIATRSRALTVLTPRTFAVLWAAMFIAISLKHFTVFCRALLTTTFGLNSDSEGLLLCSNCTVATAILALFSALVKTAP